jgi:hypothetical protein
VAYTVGEVLGAYYYHHRTLEGMFVQAGAPGDPPEGNCVVKCTEWLLRCNAVAGVQPLEVLGGVLERFMDVEPAMVTPEMTKARERVVRSLEKFGLTYQLGGRIIGPSSAAATRPLAAMVRARDLPALEREVERALAAVAADPPAALTAASSLVEAVCKVYIEDAGRPMPADQSAKPLWGVVQKDLGLDPAAVEDQDMKRILGGLASVVDGLAALRTHAGSAHGRGRKSYRIQPRHARLAINAAHSLVLFVLETWDARADARATPPAGTPPAGTPAANALPWARRGTTS